ncbi:MAG: hypothetical protein JWR17_4914 [Pseudomonas sp.]|jgi:hypothetical protein|uniref:hypothetical protein n=1 Tax=Pseudomonas sp. TaxID=306 RepID=UPI0026039229|nr:hypothetical protein [Pseudomonas sp.]MDB6052168.1 hypothetical protein [Pseudomonas sp.]
MVLTDWGGLPAGTLNALRVDGAQTISRSLPVVARLSKSECMEHLPIRFPVVADVFANEAMRYPDKPQMSGKEG